MSSMTHPIRYVHVYVSHFVVFCKSKSKQRICPNGRDVFWRLITRQTFRRILAFDSHKIKRVTLDVMFWLLACGINSNGIHKHIYSRAGRRTKKPPRDRNDEIPAAKSFHFAVDVTLPTEKTTATRSKHLKSNINARETHLAVLLAPANSQNASMFQHLNAMRRIVELFAHADQPAFTFTLQTYNWRWGISIWKKNQIHEPSLHSRRGEWSPFHVA